MLQQNHNCPRLLKRSKTGWTARGAALWHARGVSIGLMLREGDCAKKDGRCTLGIMASIWGGVALAAETEKDTLTTIGII